MDFPLLELHGWGKRPVIQPKTIDSEVPQVSFSLQCAEAGGIMGVSCKLGF